MKCEECKRKIPRVAYKWLERNLCYHCFERLRDKDIDNYDIDWNYEMIDAKKPTITLEKFW